MTAMNPIDLPPWEGGPTDDDGHYLRDWQARVNTIIRERGLEPEELVPDEDDLSAYYGLFQTHPADLVDLLVEWRDAVGPK